MNITTVSCIRILLILPFLFILNKSWAESPAELAAMLEESRSKSNWQKVKLINRWVNQAASQSTDLLIWQQEDYWASPLELLNKKSADCEDFAITKYLLLKEAGLSMTTLYLSHVELEGQSEPHMVLVYHNMDDQGFYILDNVEALIKPTVFRGDLHYKYSFNEHGIYSGEPGQFAIIPNASPTQLQMWQQVLNKWQQERVFIKVED